MNVCLGITGPSTSDGGNELFLDVIETSIVDTREVLVAYVVLHGGCLLDLEFLGEDLQTKLLVALDVIGSGARNVALGI